MLKLEMKDFILMWRFLSQNI